MAPPGDDRAGEFLNRDKSQGSQISDDGQQWEDFTRVGRWEELVGCVEDVLRDWSCAEADEAPTNNCNTNISRARCLEHDGQLFSINLVAWAPPAELYPSSITSSTKPPESSTAPPTIHATVSRACDLDNPSLDFAAYGRVTPPQRWFGLKQYVLVRGLGRAGADGISDDQLLWAATVAAASCRCSIPVLVSCDWEGVEGEGEFGGERGVVGEGRDGEGGGAGGASCKGYSAPGSKGTACSVRFQTAWTDQPPSEFIYLDGLTDLFLSKIKDAHCLPGRAFAPRVSTNVQQVWEWIKPDPETPTPAPGLLWAGTFWSKRRSDLAPARARVKGGGVEGVSGDEAGETTAVAAAAERDDNLRRQAVGRLLRAIGGGDETTPLWGPGEDQLEAICVRVRWEDLRAGLAEENEHYTTLEPLPEEGSGSVLGSSAGHWFVTARWKQRVRLANGGNSQASGGRLGDACSRLLGALVLASAMHPGTLMADLGAAQGLESPTEMAEDYGKAAADVLSADTRASVEKLCSNSRSPPIAHDRIDIILRDLLRPRERDAVVITVAQSEQEEPTPPQVVETSTGDHESLAPEPRLGRVHPKQAVETPRRRQSGERSRAPGGEAAVEAVGVDTESGVEDAEKDGWWAGEARGRVPVARLVSLLSLRVAECDDLRSMALLWMSFVRDVRLVWEDGATIERMGAMPEVDGTSMLDIFECGTRGGTGQSRSVAARLRGKRAWPTDPSGRGFRRRRRDREDDESGSVVAPSFVGGAGDPVYPDTRMCLVWQKLQMLNCCRVEIVASEDAAAGVDARNARDVVDGEEGSGEEVEDDGEVFYDTREYCQQSDGESDRRVDGGQRQHQEPEQEPDQDERHIGDYDDDKGEGGGEGSAAGRGYPLHPEKEACGASSHPAGASSDPAEGQAISSITAAAAATSTEVVEAPSCVAPTPAPSGVAPTLAPASAPAPTPSADRSTIREVSKATAAGGRVQEESAVVDEPGVDGAAVSDDRAGAKALPESLSASVFEVDGAEGDSDLEKTAAAEAAAAAVPPPASDGVDGDGSADDVGPPSEGFPQVAGVSGGEGDDKAPLTLLADLEASAPPTVTVASEEGEAEQDQGGRTPSPYAAAGVGERLGTGNEPHLLRTGVAVRSPRLQPSGPVTGDMLEQQALGQARAYRERSVLRADMKAFLGENLGAVFADFVRWYRPECWKDAAGNDGGAPLRGGSSEGRMTTKDNSNSGIGGGAVDDRRLAWPGQGQILWKNPDLVDNAPLAPTDKNASELGTPSPSTGGSAAAAAAAAASTGLTLAGWLSCWGEARVAAETGGRGDRGGLGGGSLFNAVKEGEKALHYLETISPGPLLLQLLSALLGLSATLLEEAASSSSYGLPAAQEMAASARRKVAKAVELLAAMTAEVEGSNAAGSFENYCNDDGRNPSLSFPTALLAADVACLEVKRAEAALARAVSLQLALPGQRDLANAIVASQAVEEGAEAPVGERPHKEFLRDLLLAQGMAKAAGAEPEDMGLLTSYDEDQSRKDTHGGRLEERADADGTMPPPHTKEYVLRCQTPAPYNERNLGRGQISAYPTPPSRMYAKTDGRHLRVAVSICESEV